MRPEVAQLFDAMAGTYDQLEPWYEHLYARLHAIIRAELAPRAGMDRRALDAGCGTGFQTAILSDLGFQSHGVDRSAGLLKVARAQRASAAFVRGDLHALPYHDESFDVVSCCGSTLSLVEAPGLTLAEIGRVMRPGALLVLECEHKWSLDLAWALLSSLTRDALGYGVPLKTLCQQLAGPLRDGCRLPYPVAPASGDGVSWHLRLFTESELAALLGRAGLRLRRTWGIHMLTNLIPSTVLHRERLPRSLATCYRMLCGLDGLLERAWVAQRVANSLVIVAEKST